MQRQTTGNETGLAASSGIEARAKDTQATLDQAASKVHDTVDRVHRKATEVTDRVTSDGERMYDQACGWVREHPMQAVAGVFLAGYLFGRIRS